MVKLWSIFRVHKRFSDRFLWIQVLHDEVMSLTGSGCESQAQRSRGRPLRSSKLPTASEPLMMIEAGEHLMMIVTRVCVCVCVWCVVCVCVCARERKREIARKRDRERERETWCSVCGASAQASRAFKGRSLSGSFSNGPSSSTCPDTPNFSMCFPILSMPDSRALRREMSQIGPFSRNRSIREYFSGRWRHVLEHFLLLAIIDLELVGWP